MDLLKMTPGEVKRKDAQTIAKIKRDSAKAERDYKAANRKALQEAKRGHKI
jgi:hypothetical protein